MTSIEVGEVAMVPLSSIEMSDRARKELGNIDDLELSIKESGLIQPLAVQKNGDGYKLVAGGRRFTVLTRNGVETVPIRIFESGLSDLEIKVIEYAENFHRKDLEYWENDDLLRRITELKQNQLGKKATGGAAEHSTGWGLKDTADLMGVTDATVSTAIKRSKAREEYPDLFKSAKTQKDATTIMKKTRDDLIRQEIVKEIEKGKTENRATQLGKLYKLQDFFEGVKTIPDRTIKLVEIDPPYAIRLGSVKKSSGESQYQVGDYNEVPADGYPNFLADTFRECYRVMRDHSWLICWFGPEPWFEVVHDLLVDAGFRTTRMCGIWIKGYGQSARPDIRLANSYEMFFYAWKGSPTLNKAGSTNLFTHAPVHPQQKTHPTERPIELMEDIYSTFADVGERVLIPFLGSGNGILAADKLNMAPIGFELSESYRNSFLVKVHNAQSIK